MSAPSLSNRVKLRVLTFGCIALCAFTARAQEIATLKSLHSFSGDGSYPVAGLVLAGDGNFYGVTSNGGGANGDGTVFRMTGAGTVTTLHAFDANADGSQPFAGLLAADDGSFYGTTESGGGDANGDGTVFKMTSDGTVTVLHAFHGDDGSQPHAGLTRGGDGNFYGTTTYGGASGNGTVFRVTPSGAVTALYSFAGGDDGSYPVAGLVLGGDGNFYGTTSDGGDANGDGTVFQITPAGALTTIHHFSGTDGYQPTGKLAVGRDGNFYGTTDNGGANGFGTVFRMAATGDLTTLYHFGGGTDGAYPYAGLAVASDGNLYGTTSAGGDANGDGTVFQITPAGILTTLYLFTGCDWSETQTCLFVGSDGDLYGTTSAGGTGDEGTIFKLTVASAPTFFAGEVALGESFYYLAFPNGNYFGYYAFLSDPHYVYHFDLGWQYVFNAADGHDGVYLYDFASNDFFYTSPSFPFPYLYDFGLGSVVYYFPDPANAGHYTTNPRYFYDFAHGKIITK